jgi:hypothetical protein
MDVNIDKMNCNLSCFEELSPLKYFKQFNVYQDVALYTKNITICNIESTTPNIEVCSTKIIDTKIIKTMQGTSLEGQHLSGKKLIIVGTVNLSLVLEYYVNCKRSKGLNKSDILKVSIPFSTFIIIPKETCDQEPVNLKYLIEDVTVTNISTDKVFVSVTMLMQYIDEY